MLNFCSRFHYKVRCNELGRYMVSWRQFCDLTSCSCCIICRVLCTLGKCGSSSGFTVQVCPLLSANYWIQACDVSHLVAVVQCVEISTFVDLEFRVSRYYDSSNLQHVIQPAQFILFLSERKVHSSIYLCQQIASLTSLRGFGVHAQSPVLQEQPIPGLTK